MKDNNSKQDLDVAIKMIHPHVEEMVKTDMELLAHIAHLIDKFPALEILSIGILQMMIMIIIYYYSSNNNSYKINLIIIVLIIMIIIIMIIIIINLL